MTTKTLMRYTDLSIRQQEQVAKEWADLAVREGVEVEIDGEYGGTVSFVSVGYAMACLASDPTPQYWVDDQGNVRS